MAFNFPNTPTEGQIFTDAASGAQYRYTNGVWMQVSAAQIKLAANPANLIINSAPQQSQQNAFQTPYNSGFYIADQWYNAFSGPTFSTHYIGSACNAAAAGGPFLAMTVGTTAYTSVAAGNFAVVYQPVEGLVAAPLKWGTADAVPGVLAFDVQCTVAGSFACFVKSSDTGLACVFPITIAAGDINKWKRVSYVVPATTSGAFPSSTALGLYVGFCSMAGTTYQAPSTGAWVSGHYYGFTGMSNLLATATAILRVRNIGLYADPDQTGVAPPYVVPDLETELIKCQRYYVQQMVHAQGAAAGFYITPVYFPAMRAVPAYANVTGGSSSNLTTLSTSVSSQTSGYLQIQVNASGNGYVLNRLESFSARM